MKERKQAHTKLIVVGNGTKALFTKWKWK